MKNSDFIQMKQCHIYSIKFPTENIKAVLEQAEFELATNEVKVEVVRNPMTNEKVLELENGIFFTLRTTFKKLTRELLTEKIYELKNGGFEKIKFIVNFDEPESEKEWKELAERILFENVPFSSELVNVFYSPEQELLFASSKSKQSQTALNHLIKLFDLVGFRSIVVSKEKLGLNAKLTHYLEHQNTFLFKYLDFQHEATLRKQDADSELFLTCRHLDSEDGRYKALEALRNGFVVQSMAMGCEVDGFCVNFKLDEHLKIRSLLFTECADVSKQLNKLHVAAKNQILYEYLNAQFAVLLNIAKCTVLEFVDQTKLENFV